MNILKKYLLSNVYRNIPDEQGGDDQTENGQQTTDATEKPLENGEQVADEVVAEALDTTAGNAETVADTAAAQSDEEINDWREKQIAKQHKRIQQEKAGRERAEQQLAEVLANRKPTTETETATERTAPAAAALSEDEVNRRATVIAEQSRFTERLTALNEQGEKTHGKDWNAALNRLTQIGDGTMPDLPWIMNALPEQAAKLLVDLGKNPAEMLRISELPVERRQAEYFKKAMTTAPTTKKVSNAPAPVEKVASRATVPAGQLRDDMSDEAWSAVRGAQRKARWEQQQRR